PSFDFPNISEPYNNTPRTFRAVTTPQFNDQLSMVRGNQVFGFGLNVRFYRHVDQRGQPGGINVTPTVTFAGSTRNPPGFTAFSATNPNAPSGLPATFTATSPTNLNGRPGISSTDRK